jgi:hypothetical protein
VVQVLVNPPFAIISLHLLILKIPKVRIQYLKSTYTLFSIIYPVNVVNVEKEVNLCIDDEESKILFIDHAHGEKMVCRTHQKCCKHHNLSLALEKKLLTDDVKIIFKQIISPQSSYVKIYLQLENMVGTYNPQGFVVVVAVNDEASLELGERMLHFINMLEVSEKTVILVANKADLVKTRVVKPIGNKNGLFIFTYPNMVQSFSLYFSLYCVSLVKSNVFHSSG